MGTFSQRDARYFHQTPAVNKVKNASPGCFSIPRDAACNGSDQVDSMVQSSVEVRRITMPTAKISSEAAIWARIIEPEQNGLSPEAARSLLELRFCERDVARMNDLAQKNREGLLTAAERQELEGYVKVGDVLSLLHLKARKSLRR
jgi:hypothetical protein